MDYKRFRPKVKVGATTDYNIFQYENGEVDISAKNQTVYYRFPDKEKAIAFMPELYIERHEYEAIVQAFSKA